MAHLPHPLSQNGTEPAGSFTASISKRRGQLSYARRSANRPVEAPVKILPLALLLSAAIFSRRAQAFPGQACAINFECVASFGEAEVCRDGVCELKSKQTSDDGTQSEGAETDFSSDASSSAK